MPSVHEAILDALPPIVAQSSPGDVARAITALSKGEPLPEPLLAHEEPLLRLAWLTMVRAPSLDAGSLATLPMLLSTIEATDKGLDDLIGLLRSLEDVAALPEGSPFEGIAALDAAGRRGDEVVASSGEALRALVGDLLQTLRRTPGALDAAIEQATERVMAQVTQGVDEGRYDDLIAGTPREKSERWVERGHDRLEEGDLQRAFEAFERAVRADPTHGRALLHRAEVLAAGGQPQQASDDFQQALALDPDARACSGYGAFLLQQEQFVPAFEHIQKALELNPDELSALANRGLLLRLANRLAEARADYQRMTEVAPNLALGHLGLGHTALQAGDPEAAAHFTRALERAPGSTEALHGRASARARHGDEAGAAADRASAAPGLQVETARLYDQARWRGILGDPEGAVADYDATLALDPGDVQALINRGVMLQELGQDALAMESWDRAVAADPTYPNAYVKRGMGHFMAGRGDRARADLCEALARAPDDWPLRDHVEGMLATLGAGEAEA